MLYAQTAYAAAKIHTAKDKAQGPGVRSTENAEAETVFRRTRGNEGPPGGIIVNYLYYGSNEGNYLELQTESVEDPVMAPRKLSSAEG